MAISSAINWEVRTTGSNTNGGGFKAGASGTDWTQQDSAQYSVTDGVTAGTTTITSATANFGTDVVGNLIYVSGGTGSITDGWYEITGRTNSTTITVDRSTGLTTGTGVTLKIGGGLASLQQAVTNWAASNTIWVKNGSYNVGTGITSSALNMLPNSKPNYIIGYNSTRGDNPRTTSRPTLTATAAINILTLADNNVLVSNLIFDCNSTGNCCLVTSSTSERGTRISYCSFRNFKTNGFQGISGTQGTGVLLGCDATGGNSGATGGFYGAATCYSCIASGNACSGFVNNASIGCYYNCISASNTGSSSRGYDYSSNSLANGVVYGCVAYGNGGDGVNIIATYAAVSVLNCLFVGNGGYGINYNHDLKIAVPLFNYNAFYNNTSGARNSNLSAGYNDVTLTGDPFTNAGSGDFSLNNTASAGAACRAVGFPGLFPGGLTTGYADIGAAQHQDAGGGGGLACNPVGGFIG